MSVLSGLKKPWSIILLASGIAAIAFSIAAFVLSDSLENEDSGPIVTSKREKIVFPVEEVPSAGHTEATPAQVAQPRQASALEQTAKPVAKKDPGEIKSIDEKDEKKEPVVAKEAIKKPAPSVPKDNDQKEKKKKTANTGAKDKKEKTAKKPEPKQVTTKEGPFKPWVVNVASFSGQKEAEEFIISLKAKGYAAYRTEFTKNKRLWHRVRVGFFSTVKDARKTGAAIEKEFNVRGAWVAKVARQEAARQK
ncbi:MAG: SPOR domain-containing protein [Deltaproteobacteria bacterium]